MGVPDDIAETVLPLWANIHKGGSVMTGIIKTVFIFTLSGTNIGSFDNTLAIIGVALLGGDVVGAIPYGGSTERF